jgi:hypothetical protein
MVSAGSIGLLHDDAQKAISGEASVDERCGVAEECP